MLTEEQVLIIGTLLFFFLAAFIVAFAVRYRKEQLKFIIEKQKFEQEILQAEVEIKEKTLQDVGGELHDNIGQIASLTRMTIAGFQPQTVTTEKIDRSLSLLDNLIQEVRSLSHQLSEGLRLRKSLAKQIEQDIDRLKNAGGLTIQFVHDTSGLKVTGDKSILIYRIFQEGLSNVVKHARATEVTVHLNETGENVRLSIEDDGRGIDKGEGRGDGIGMKNMRSRAALIGAKLSFAERQPKGTELKLEIPKENLYEED